MSPLRSAATSPPPPLAAAASLSLAHLGAARGSPRRRFAAAVSPSPPPPLRRRRFAIAGASWRRSGIASSLFWLRLHSHLFDVEVARSVLARRRFSGFAVVFLLGSLSASSLSLPLLRRVSAFLRLHAARIFAYVSACFRRLGSRASRFYAASLLFLFV